MNSTDPDTTQETQAHAHAESEFVTDALSLGKNKRVRKLLGRVHPAKIAALLEQLDVGQRTAPWQQVDTALQGRILQHLNIHLSRQLAGDSDDATPQEPAEPAQGGDVNPQPVNLDPDNLIALVQALELDDLVDLIQSLPPALGS